MGIGRRDTSRPASCWESDNETRNQPFLERVRPCLLFSSIVTGQSKTDTWGNRKQGLPPHTMPPHTMR